MAILYENDETNYKLEETLALDCQGLILQGQEDQSTVEVNLGPGKKKLLRFDVDPNATQIAFSYNVPSCQLHPC